MIQLRSPSITIIMTKLTKKTIFYGIVIFQAIILLYIITLHDKDTNGILDFTKTPLAWFFSNNEETSFVLNTTHICYSLTPRIKNKAGEAFLIVLVMSKAYYEDTREVVRDTWASKKNNKSTENSHVIFVVGCTPSMHLDREVDREASKYHDILRVDFQEEKDPHEIKRLWLAYQWTIKYQPKFVIKTSFHVYVRLPRLVQWLKESGNSDKLYAGKVHSQVAVNRNSNKTFFVSEKEYSLSTFPDYCSGVFYVFSGSLLKDLLALEQKVPKFNVEDAYFGVLMKELEVQPTAIDSKLHIQEGLGNDVQSWTNQMYKDVFVIGMNLQPSSLLYIHDRYKRIEEKTV